MAKALATRTRTVYIKRAKHRSKAGFTLPIAVLAGFAPLGFNAIKDYRDGGLQVLGKGLVLRTTGMNTDTGKWMPEYLMQGLGPIVAGVFVHKLASKLGINRALAGAGVPFLRV
jgi:hypothetical protein